MPRLTRVCQLPPQLPPAAHTGTGAQPDETARAQRLASRSRSRSLPGRRGSPLRLQGPVLGQPDQQQENRERQGGPARRPGPRSLPDSEEAWRVARRRLGRQKALPGTVVRGTEGPGGAPCTLSSERPVAVCLVSSGCSGEGGAEPFGTPTSAPLSMSMLRLCPHPLLCLRICTHIYAEICIHIHTHTDRPVDKGMKLGIYYTSSSISHAIDML